MARTERQKAQRRERDRAARRAASRREAKQQAEATAAVFKERNAPQQGERPGERNVTPKPAPKRDSQRPRTPTVLAGRGELGSQAEEVLDWALIVWELLEYKNSHGESYDCPHTIRYFDTEAEARAAIPASATLCAAELRLEPQEFDGDDTALTPKWRQDETATVYTVIRTVRMIDFRPEADGSDDDDELRRWADD